MLKIDRQRIIRIQKTFDNNNVLRFKPIWNCETGVIGVIEHEQRIFFNKTEVTPKKRIGTVESVDENRVVTLQEDVDTIEDIILDHTELVSRISITDRYFNTWLGFESEQILSRVLLENFNDVWMIAKFYYIYDHKTDGKKKHIYNELRFDGVGWTSHESPVEPIATAKMCDSVAKRRKTYGWME